MKNWMTQNAELKVLFFSHFSHFFQEQFVLFYRTQIRLYNGEVMKGLSELYDCILKEFSVQKKRLSFKNDENKYIQLDVKAKAFNDLAADVIMQVWE